MQDINELVQMIYTLKNQGKNPNEVYQLLMQRHPNYNLALTRYQNMTQGRNPKDFILQMARQNGLSEQNAKLLAEMLNT